jgi:hypothetical protein
VTRPDRADKTTKSDGSEPDLASLDAAWEDEPNEDDVDEGWVTVPDPKGGPPQRRRLPPKERAQKKREKQRLRAEAAAQKQKKKKTRSRGRDDDGDHEDEKRAPAEAAKAKSTQTRKPRSAPIRRKTFDVRTIPLIAAALAVAAVALYFMLTSRR